ncbi:isocitrate lyase/PEP mutase family protein [Novosphingobium sp. SG707]|uniref:isocitrate lyase/PEP mutase family protein n=1 Tax=Novosphingobium sp. SG707 TaxID=2586996 RepID=UPI0014459D3B|nr:isocitrate lyase/PEP mutase family protein [Novosphingobium sp. SG707]NKJ00967.1 methylisocitrate lyase [Novosphingobium sp. SG707]
MMRKTTRLRHLIEQPGLLEMPGAYEPMGAKLIEKAGFEAIQCSGLGISATYLGLPDYSMLAMSDMVAATRLIASAVDIPVMADGDTGFGNAVNVFYAVQAFEAAGAAGMNLEDQVMPKRCGHLDGKQVVSLEEAVAKISAACAARRDPDFVINARTDALASHGIDEVIRRGNAYLEAGATMVFVEGAATLDLIAQAVRGIRGPVGVNIVHGGKSQDLDLPELKAIGVARVSLPGLLLGAAWQAIAEVLDEVRESGRVAAVASRMHPFTAIHQLMGTPDVTALEERFLAPLKSVTEGLRA